MYKAIYVAFSATFIYSRISCSEKTMCKLMTRANSERRYRLSFGRDTFPGGTADMCSK